MISFKPVTHLALQISRHNKRICLSTFFRAAHAKLASQPRPPTSIPAANSRSFSACSFLNEHTRTIQTGFAMSLPSSSSPRAKPILTTPAPAAEEMKDDISTEVQEPGESGEPGDQGKKTDESIASSSNPQLPPLSSAEFHQYNQMAEHMEHFHNHFRQIWTMMHSACSNNKRPAGMTLRQFIDTGLQFIRMLTAHHSIEEAHVFPMLAKRMPEFQPISAKKAKVDKGQSKAAQLVQQHREIHVGMEGFEDYLRRCRSGETELQLSVLKNQMDTWGAVLWQHLDDEVRTLGAENMRKYWSLAEMRTMYM